MTVVRILVIPKVYLQIQCHQRSNPRSVKRVCVCVCVCVCVYVSLCRVEMKREV